MELESSEAFLLDQTQVFIAQIEECQAMVQHAVARSAHNAALASHYRTELTKTKEALQEAQTLLATLRGTPDTSDTDN